MSAELKEALTWWENFAAVPSPPAPSLPSELVTLAEAARRVAEAGEVWEQAHRLREAILDTIDDQNVVNLSDMFRLLQDEGVLQAWCRVVSTRLLLPDEEESEREGAYQDAQLPPNPKPERRQ